MVHGRKRRPRRRTLDDNIALLAKANAIGRLGGKLHWVDSLSPGNHDAVLLNISPQDLADVEDRSRSGRMLEDMETLDNSVVCEFEFLNTSVLSRAL